ncbi:MAG: D-2-hydroxyacid dehydrogenase [Planctomycetota bacterium]|nr:D-2-hydroxyacid dehydrogenase [Planctomycetota bacterium]
MKIVSYCPIENHLIEAMRESDPTLEVLVFPSVQELTENCADADIIFSGYDGENPEPFMKLVSRARKAKWFHTSTAGVDKLLCPERIQSGAIMTCSKGEVAGPSLAEHAMALLLAITRHIAVLVRAGEWNKRICLARGATELMGMTMGIVGFGGSGQLLARMALGFQMRVIALGRSSRPSEIEGVESVWGRERFDELLEQSDVVAICAPGTKETHHMFDTAAFKRMKNTSILINIGRGDIVSDEALIQALQQGEIAGAGLDVLEYEPPPQDSPLWQMDNVILTPHTAGHSPNRNQRNRKTFAENFGRFIRGEELVGQVDIESGY